MTGDPGVGSTPSIVGRLSDWFEVVSTTDLAELTRGGEGLHLDTSADPHLVALVEDAGTGILAWAWPEERPSRSGALSGGGATFAFSGATERGIASTVGKKVVRLLKPAIVDRALAEAGERLAAAWESRFRPERLIRCGPDAVHLADDDPALVVDRDALGTGEALLLIHGIASRTRSGFAGLRGRGLTRLSSRYEGRILGYDHPTLSRSPGDNATDLLHRLQELYDIEPFGRLDVVGYGRGGLVARSLAVEIERAGSGISLGRIWGVGTPNLGQGLADPESLRAYVDRLTNLVGWLPLGGVEDVVDGVLTTVAQLAIGAVAGLPGITDMAPTSAFLRSLNQAGDPAMSSRLFAVASNYVPRAGAKLADRARSLAASRLIPAPNDLLTSIESVFGAPEHPLVPTANQRLFSDAHGVSHADYFWHPALVDFLLDSPGSSRSAVVTAETWLPTVHDEDGAIVEISVSHCSLEEARFAVMVGTYANESLAGAERFLDHQLHGELAARFGIDRYPAELGTSLFLSTGDDDNASGMSGAYVVGLGSTLSLGRPELTRTVRQALVDRCLEIYRDPPSGGASVIEVGVSTTLLGVRNNDGLTVGESVAGIVEGVLEANRALVRYEQHRAVPSHPVRITALEFVERYADRADRVAIAVRSLPTLVRLGPGYDQLQQLTVDSSKRGGLPAGSAVNDSPQDWHRFVITGTPVAAAPADRASGGLQLEITALGADARADRVVHELDQTVVDALVDRLGRNRSDQAAAATLFNVLVPDELRVKFQSTSAVQFVVDAATANLPWELLSAPRSGQFRRLAESTSVVRQFTENGERRLAPLRSRSGRALVIAAGNLPGLPKLPGVYEEADAVTAAQRRHTGLEVSVVHDRAGPLDPAELMIALLGEHQVVHIASHGDYVDGDPARTGALLADNIVLTAAKVRLLPTVPELVFLNCCNLARIGLNRMAAGLARELMAIGVRAVVAAGWPVGDAAAVAFAETFYDQFLGGATFGEAVASARLACASAAGGGETWAAYQCYGDPTLVFSGATPSTQENRSEPASEDDLHRRLIALGVRASDLGRPGEAGLERRRATLLEALNVLATWADDHGYAGVSSVQRRIGKVAHELGEFAVAGERYLRMVSEEPGDDPVGVRLNGGAASAADLHQAANCLARDGRSADHATQCATMARAVRLAEAACRIVGDRESFGILGGVRRRWAVVEPSRRDEHLTASFSAYQRAVAASSADAAGVRRIGTYGLENARQIAALLGRDDPYPTASSDRVAAPSPPRWVDERSTLQVSFWDGAGVGDRLLSDLLFQRDPSLAPTITDRMIAAYERAFVARSTFSERNSVLDHLRGLHALVDGDAAWTGVAAELRRACDRLEGWERRNVDPAPAVAGSATGASADGAAGASGAGVTGAPGAAAGDGAGPSDVLTLTSLPAGKGDCLVVEYASPGRHQHRVVIDGGLASSYADGFGAFAARHGNDGVLPADVLVVTHIDADHIGGAITMLEQGSVDAKDIWFNGLEQLVGARGVTQADAFSRLIPTERRNCVVAHRLLVVPDAGPLPSLPLPGGAQCTLLSPTTATLDRLTALWQRANDRGGEGPGPTEVIDRFDQEETESERGSGPVRFGADGSVPNGSSIAFLLEHGGRALLLAGDAHAPVLQSAIERMLEQRRAQQLHLDVFKLSHHSSRNNVSVELLELLTVDCFLVCTSGNASHPDVDALRLIGAKFPAAAFRFSDGSEPVRTAAAEAGVGDRSVFPAPGELQRIGLGPVDG